MERIICIDSNNTIKWKNISDIEKMEKIVIQVNSEVYDILTNPKTELSKIKSIVNDILESKIDYE
jgi:hypothetical protein